MEVNQRKLRKSIRRMNKVLIREIPNLNRGGCGWFAYYTSTKLTQIGVDHKIVVVSNNHSIEDKLDTINLFNNGDLKDLSEYDLGKTSFSHCYIKMGRYIFDGHQRNEKLKFKWGGFYSSYKGVYTTEDMRTALKIGNWNSKYNFNKHNDFLKQVINKYIN